MAREPLKLSAWDRFTLNVAPRWAMRRIQARVAAYNFARHFEAAQPGRRTGGWQGTNADADLALRGSLIFLRQHVRDLCRNNGWAKNAKRIISRNTVGTGIVPKAISPNASAARAAQDIWRAWGATTECESDNRQTVYGIQSLVMKSIYESGEALIRRRYRRMSDGLTVPLQLQVLEADFLDQNRNYFADNQKGPTIQGVEFDKLGRRAAYWIYPEHPGSGRNYKASERIPADQVIHVYEVERPGQSRGIPWLGASILSLKDFDEWEDATLMKQKIASCMAAFVEDIEGLGAPIAAIGAGTVDPTDPLVETFEPGMIQKLPPGKKITIASPPSVVEEEFPARTQRKVAATLGVTYEELTMDYSKVNFSSARQARIAVRQNIDEWQEHMLIPILCDGIWAWMVEAAQLAGKLPPLVPVVADWTCPAMPMIEPDKEGLAIQRMVRTGVKTLSQAIREQGMDPEAVLSEIAADNAKLDELGIVLDSDPRETTQTGQKQTDPAAAGGEPDADDKKKPAA